MSNALKIPAVEIEIPSEYLADIPPCVRDMDGNEIESDTVHKPVIWKPAEFQTRRELKSFVSQHIGPYIAEEFKDRVRVDIDGVTEESDGFQEEFTLTVTYSANWEKVI